MRRAVSLLLGLSLLATGCGGDRRVERSERSNEALDAAGLCLGWLEQNAPLPGDPWRERTLDALAWFFFAIAHPDPAVRAGAGETLDARLAAIPPAEGENAVGMTYAAMVVRMKRWRGLDLTRDHAALAAADLPNLLAGLAPGTVWFTTELMRRSGLDVETDFSKTFIATTAARNDPRVEFSAREAVIVFHELIPALDFGLSEPSGIDERQLDFVRRSAPALLDAARESGDTDALAEALITAALLDVRDSDAYREGWSTLLSRQQPDGTFRSDVQRTMKRPAAYRHVVAVGGWALLTSLE